MCVPTARSNVLAEVAEVLERRDAARRYRSLAEETRTAWQQAFVRDGGARIGIDRQDDYVRALAFDLLPECQRAAAVSRLVELVERAGDHLGTGFLSTPMLLFALSEHGRADVAYRVLLQTSGPSWLDQVASGQTTLRENWHNMDRKGRRTGSSNHYASGSVVEWMVGGIVGITPLAPGYRKVRFAPILGGGLTHAAASIETPFGTVAAAWRHEPDGPVYEVDLPLGTTGVVRLLDGTETDVFPGRNRVALAPAAV